MYRDLCTSSHFFSFLLCFCEHIRLTFEVRFCCLPCQAFLEEVHLLSDNQRKEAVMAQVRAEVQALNAKELMDNLTDKCYLKCVTKPGTSMSSSEEVRN